MPSKTRHRVTCDLDQAEYERQQQVARTQPGIHPPLLEMHGVHNVRFNETHCGRIAADAYAAALSEPTNIGQDAVEEAVPAWTMEQKLQFMQDAAGAGCPPTGRNSPTGTAPIPRPWPSSNATPMS